MTETTQSRSHAQTTIEADREVPAIRLSREFAATPEQLFAAHTDPELFARWIGPDGMENRITRWDAHDGGGWRYEASRDGETYCFRGCFHTVRTDRIVQTFTFEGMPDHVALETLTFTDLGNGRTRLDAFSLCDSFEDRDQWLASGMEEGVQDGYAKIDGMLADGTL